MDEVINNNIEMLTKLQKKLERESLQAGRLKNLNKFYDWITATDILRLMDVENLSWFYQNYPETRDYSNCGLLFKQDGIKVCSNLMDLYKEAEFIPFNNLGQYRLSKKDSNEIMCDYLDYMMPNGSKLLRDMSNNGRILLGDLNDSSFGITFNFKTLDDAFIFIDSRLKEYGVCYMKTIIHELMHKYGADKARLSTRLRDYLDYSPLTEILSMYSELSFSEYLRRNHILPKITEFELNDNYQTYLDMIKEHYTMLNTIANGGGLEYSSAYNFTAALPGNVPFLEEDVDPTFSITEADSDGSIYNFNYVLGFIKAMDLFRREKDGENIKEMIDNTLFEFDTDDCIEDYYYDESNYEFIKDQIKTNTDNCKKLYKIK